MAGIYWNEEEGLISLSSDGTNWITIADKNLGATTVYNNGDTLNETNGGKFYQWGNIYGFPYTGATSKQSSSANALNYGPYYKSGNWITQTQWESSSNSNLWGGNINTNDAMQGPCDDGYHIPSETDITNLTTVLTNLGAYAAHETHIYLKMPLSGNISYDGTTKNNLGSFGQYWLAQIGNSNDVGKYFYVGNSVGTTQLYKGHGATIRPFKNVSVTPDGSWTVLYQGSGSTGIFHNEELGLISISSDGNNWITIADKNLGATQVWNDGDTLNEGNCGNYFQWGNCYGFPFSGPKTKVTGLVNAQYYGPYFNSNTFLTTSRWNAQQNKNLWGGETGTNEAMRGPCARGFHIPSYNNLTSLINLLKSLGIIDNSGNVSDSSIKQYLKMPFSGSIAYSNGTHQNEGTYCFLWTSTASNDDYGMSQVYYFNNNKVETIANYNGVGSSIRPFSNEIVIPDYNDTWETLYGDELPDRPVPPEPPKPKLKWIIKGINYYYFGDRPTHASGITLNKSSITLSTTGQAEQLTATITPEDAVNKKVLWSSSNASVATVSSTGLVTCVTPGECTITCTAVDGGASASCSVSEPALITTPGVYHNATLGLISLSSDGTNWITLADKNLGATETYEYGDEISAANNGNYYQWGNNHAFPYGVIPTNTSNQRENLSDYGPGNYYNSDIYHTYSSTWDNPVNLNLWGYQTYTYEAMRGPCSEGWHVPGDNDLQTLITLLNSLSLLPAYEATAFSGNGYEVLMRCLKGGMFSRLSNTPTMTNVGGLTFLSARRTSAGKIYCFMVGTYGFYHNQISDYTVLNNTGYPLRPFKNVGVQPDETWTILYQPS